ncbi:Cmx/CmrA family chloramphenicol efflux MFS transporter [Streptomyces sp. CAU 1734]|uniref:Cmx/CmrA family chloramphenicol efflux MFS transporter n=1 Tax=Streptomyces sp. CAU 1734 TaxID=3140360 RepID=UPI0032605DB8
MPLVLLLLGLAVFAQGTSEFMLAGLIPDISRDLQVSIPAAGALTSAFAVGMVVGAPLMALLGMRWSQRRALLTFLVVFLLVHVVGALATDYAVLLATRLVAAPAYAGFLAVALATAAGLVPPGARGRAASVLLGGVTLACVVGVPGGALLGRIWGWRAVFWAVALLSLPAVAAIVKWVPESTPDRASGARRAQLRALRRTPGLGTLLLLSALVNGATFCTFTYLAPLITEVGGIGPDRVPAVLALFGAGSLIGVTVAGRYADTHSPALLRVCGAALLAGWIVLAVSAGNPVAALVLVLVQGALSFAVGSVLVSRVLHTASGAPDLAGASATTAFNAGAAVGPWLGGAAITAEAGYRAPVWVSAGLVAAAGAVALAAGLRALRRRGKPLGPGREGSVQ